MRFQRNGDIFVHKGRRGVQGQLVFEGSGLVKGYSLSLGKLQRSELPKNRVKFLGKYKVPRRMKGTQSETGNSSFVHSLHFPVLAVMLVVGL